MLNYSIKDLENLCGIKAHTIRTWEVRYNLFNPERTKTNVRIYTDSDLKLLLQISLLKDSGTSISKIAKMNLAERLENIEKIQYCDFKGNDKYASSLIEAMIDFNEANFCKTITNFNKKGGFEKTLLHLIIPFLSKVGNLWLNDSLMVGYEHFISNLIRKEIIRASVQIENKKNINKKNVKVLLFNKQKEHHELTLMMCDFFFKSRGYQTFYIGTDVPYKSVKLINETIKPDLITTVFTVACDKTKDENYIRQMSKDLLNVELWFCGNINSSCDFKYYKNVKILHSFQKLTKMMNDYPKR